MRIIIFVGEQVFCSWLFHTNHFLDLQREVTIWFIALLCGS